MVRYFILICFLLSTLCISAQTDKVSVGQSCPEFSYQASDGTIHAFSELKSKVVWINFFATWCGPCRLELPRLEKEVWQTNKQRSDFVLLVIGRQHTYDELNKFRSNNNYSFQMIADPKREIYSLFATQFIPRNYLIDKTGKIVYASSGYEEQDFTNMIQKLSVLLK